jgi:hypothetical protein
VGKLRKGDHLEGPGLDGKVILKWIFEKWNWAGGGGGILCFVKHTVWWVLITDRDEQLSSFA